MLGLVFATLGMLVLTLAGTAMVLLILLEWKDFRR